jgi:hypothetical protein
MKHLLRSSLAFAVVLASLAALSLAQTAGTGAIAGAITDPNSAVVGGASISAIDMTTGEKRTVVSSSTGTYLVPLLPPATYRVEVSKSGFKLSVNADVPVHITETTTVNVKLEIGATRETVEVKANSELLKTEQSTLGNVVDQKEVSALPLVTRNYSQILGLSPGVSAETFNAGEIGRGGVDDSLVTGGSAANDNNYQMNGVEINDWQSSGHYSGGVATPNPDSIQEFKVQTSQYDASYGRNAGANVDVLTKMGTNSWHGNVWEYFRNEDLNANDYFRNGTGEPRAVLRQNQFGFTLGGPIKRDKLLFFTSYQGTRQKNGIDPSCSSSVILPVLTSGTDRTDPNAIAASVGPNTAFGGVALPGVLVTGSNVSSQAMALFSAKLPNGQYVIPNPQTTITDPTTGLPEGFSTYSTPCPYSEDQFITNLDWLQNAKSTFQGRFFFANSAATFTLPGAQTVGATVPGAPLSNPQNFRNFSLSHTYLFTTHLVNQAELGFHRTHSGTSQSFPFSYSDIGSTVPSFDNARPVISVLGGFNIGGNGQSVILGQNTYVLQDTVSWLRGRHSFRFGGGISRAQDNMTTFAYGGYSVFYNYPGLLYGQAPLNPFETVDLAGLSGRNWRIWDGNIYAQDDVKVTSRLTLNLGFRYERLGDPGEINGRNATMNPALINPNPPASGSLNGILVSDNFPGTLPSGVVSSGNNMGIYGKRQNTLNPRIGFAWSLPGTNRLVLRGGYGVYHQRTTGQLYLQQISNQPFGLIRAVAPNFTNGFASPFPPDPGAFPQFVPYSPTTSLSPFLIDPNIRPPILQRYSLNLQAQLGRDFVLQIGYAGMRGTHMLMVRDIDQASLASVGNPIRGETTNTVANVPLRVPYEGFSSSQFFSSQSNGFAWYNALEASLSKRFSHGLQFLASYTFARDLTNTGYNGTVFGYGGVTYGNNNDPHFDYGPDSFIRPQRFVFSAVYEFPSPSNRHSLRGQTLGGWKLAGVETIQSGHRLPLLNLNTSSVYGIIYDVPDIVPGCAVETGGSTTHRLNNWINRSCVTSPPVIGNEEPPGTCLTPLPDGNCPPIATAIGNSRMGILHGPDQINTDLSLIKLFPIHEAINVEFRSEFFNAFNHPNFQDPDLYYSDGPAFGQITEMAGNPRILQFALKVNF